MHLADLIPTQSRPSRHSWPAVIAAAVITLSIVTPATCQQLRSSADPTITQASFDRTIPHDGQQVVRFGRQPARVGDRVEQTISLEMRLATSIRRGDELFEKNHTTVRADQRRIVMTTEVDAGRTTAVLVRYLDSTKQINVTEDAAAPAANGSDAATEPSSPEAQPVQGKEYICRREPGDEGKLIVTDAKGNIPPLDEYEIVVQNMEMVGRPNPLVQFLAGRTVAVGETIELPKGIADGVFNLSDRLGKVTRFDLKLETIQPEDRCAVFRARVEAASTDASQMRLEVEGPVVVQIDNCRAVRTALAGPIGLSETRGSYSTASQLLGTGRLQMQIASAYRDAKR